MYINNNRTLALKFKLLNTFFCKKMRSNLVQVPFKARCTISMFHWNETEWSTTTKSDCILSAYSQFEITCWDFNDHYIWKFSLLLYLRIVHIYIMLNKKNQLNLYVIVLPLNIPSIYSGTFILFFFFFLEWVYQRFA